MARRDAGGAMERDQMSRLVIGLGFCDQATAQSIGEVVACAVRQAAMPDTATVLAVVEDKAAHPSLFAAVQASKYPIETVTADAMRRADARITTRSERVIRQRGVGSACEATALAVAGASARLVVTRLVSVDRTATAAAAMMEETAP
jgi:cobalt-precorrin 5A hydrolase